MKKKYQVKKKELPIKKLGAYDKDGKFWHKQDIESATGGLIKVCFGVEKEYILIIEKCKNDRQRENLTNGKKPQYR